MIYLITASFIARVKTTEPMPPLSGLTVSLPSMILLIKIMGLKEALTYALLVIMSPTSAGLVLRTGSMRKIMLTKERGNGDR